MSAGAGRKVIVTFAGGAIAACRTKSLKIEKEPIDITSDDDSGWRALLSGDVGSKSVEIAVEGVLKADTLMTNILTVDTLGAATIEFPGITKTYGGQFMLTSMELGAKHDDAVDFSGTLLSSGEFAEDAS